MWTGHSEKRGRTWPIRDHIHQTDNGTEMTTQLEAVASALRERKSILNFKQSPPQGNFQPPSPNPALLISSTQVVWFIETEMSFISRGWVFVFLLFVTQRAAAGTPCLWGGGSSGLYEHVAFLPGPRKHGWLGPGLSWDWTTWVGW